MHQDIDAHALERVLTEGERRLARRTASTPGHVDPERFRLAHTVHTGEEIVDTSDAKCRGCRAPCSRASGLHKSAVFFEKAGSFEPSARCFFEKYQTFLSNLVLLFFFFFAECVQKLQMSPA